MYKKYTLHGGVEFQGGAMRKILLMILAGMIVLAILNLDLILEIIIGGF